MKPIKKNIAVYMVKITFLKFIKQNHEFTLAFFSDL